MSESICTEFLNDESIDFSSKMPIEPSKVKLLNYYKGKVASHQSEREEWISQLEEVSHSQEYLYRLMENLKASNDHIYRLQAKMSTIQNSIFSEKHQALRLLQENKELKLLQLTDKKRLQEFISLVGPKPKSATFFQDKRPSSSKSASKLSGDCAWCAICKNYNGPKHNHKIGNSTQIPKTIVRTVYLPNEEMNSLVIETDMLKDQIEQEKEAFENELSALAEEQNVREQEKSMRKDVDYARIKELIALAEIEEEGKNVATKEYLRLRYELQEKEKELKEINQRMEGCLDSVKKKYYDVKNLAKIETKEEERQADKKTDEFSYKFRTQVIRHEENLQVIKEQYTELQVKFSGKIDELEQNITNLTQNYKDLEEKRRITKNKLNREIDQLQDKLRKLENENRSKNNLKASKNKKNDD